jgi:transposase-like protein
VIGDPGVCVNRGATRPGRRAGRAAVAVGPRADDGPSPRPSRRSFSPEYKLSIVAEYEAVPNGEKGAILRREGLYSSHVIEWARARDAGALDGVADSRRSENRRNRSRSSAESAELERLRPARSPATAAPTPPDIAGGERDAARQHLAAASSMITAVIGIPKAARYGQHGRGDRPLTEVLNERAARLVGRRDGKDRDDLPPPPPS